MELKVTCIVPIPTLAQYLYLTNNRIDIYIAPVHLKYRIDISAARVNNTIDVSQGYLPKWQLPINVQFPCCCWARPPSSS